MDAAPEGISYNRNSFFDGAGSATVTGSVNQTSAVNCNSQFSFQYSIPVLSICVMCFFIGLVYSFFGYRFFKAVLFVTGLLFGSVVIYLICDTESSLSKLAKAAVSVGAGLLFGLITMLVEYVGVFMSGFLSGLVVGVCASVALHFAAPPSSLWLTIGILFAAGVVLALVTLNWQRAFLMLGTALMGGAMVSISLDYLANHFRLIKWIWSVLNLQPSPYRSVCWYGWVILGLWPAVFVVGAAVQWKLTSVGFSHDARSVSYRAKRESTARRLSSASPRTPARTKVSNSSATGHKLNSQHSKNSQAVINCYQPKPFRHLYQARRTRGDVICQV